MPTVTRIQPPIRLTSFARACIRSRTCSCALAMEKESENIRMTIASAATAKAPSAEAALPIVRACPARPVRIGPVQPNPARR